MTDLDNAFELTASRNSEIAVSWLRIAIANNYGVANRRVEHFLAQNGRIKYVAPLYAGLIEAGKREKAAQIFNEAKPRYHPLTIAAITRMFGTNELGSIDN